MPKKPFFSVIIPTYNRCAFLKIAVTSVLQQSYRNFELIIVDDGSTDGTEEMLKQYAKSHVHKVTRSHEKIPFNTVRYFYQENKGPGAARNRGLKEAKGKYICFLDSDDRFGQHKLEHTYNYIKKYPEYKIFHTDEVWYRNGKLLPQKGYHKKPDGYVFSEALKLCSVSISTAAIRKEVFRKVGMFDESLPACEDYDFWLRATAVFKVKLIPKELTIKEGGHPDQQSKKLPAMDSFRIYALQKLLEANTINEIQRKETVSELKRKCAIYIKGATKRGKTKDIKHYTRLMNMHSS